MNINQPYLKNYYHYCPNCKTELNIAPEKIVCTNCDFVVYDDPNPSVAVVIINDRNKLLLSRRKIAPYQNYWDLPGGFIKTNEKAEAAAQREMMEEGQVEIKIIKYLLSAPDVYGDQLNICLAYLAKITRGKLQGHDDVAEFRWFKPDNIPDKIAFNTTKQIINFFKKNY